MMTDSVMLGFIGLAGTFLSGILLIVNTLITSRMGRDLKDTRDDVAATKSDIAQQKKTIETLEKNTNSMKDELVKVTGRAEFAKGLKEGTETAAAGATAPIPGAPVIPIPLPVIVVDEPPIDPNDKKWKR